MKTSKTKKKVSERPSAQGGITVFLGKEMDTVLRRIKAERGINKTHIVRQALREWIERDQGIVL